MKGIAAMGGDHSTETDEELVAATQAGDEAAFAELFERYKRTVGRVAGRFFTDRGRIEEMIQATFCRAYRSLARYRGGRAQSFPAWLCAITASLCLDELRRDRRRPEQPLPTVAEIEQRGWSESGEQRLISRDLATYLLAQLAPEDRLTLTLLYEEEWTLAEIARLLGWSVAKTKGRAYQARQALQKIMRRLKGEA